MRYWILAAALFIGASLRLQNLGSASLWVDEGLFVKFWSGNTMQEFIPLVIFGVFQPVSEFWVRFPFALAGILTIPAVYFVIPDKRYAVLCALFVAVFPLFVWWSRLARPYVFVGLFSVLGWRYTWVHTLAVLTSPVALVGFKWPQITKTWKWVLVLSVVSGVLYFIRPDAGRFISSTWEFFYHAKRHWYLPLLLLVMYCGEYVLPYAERKYNEFSARSSGLVR